METSKRFNVRTSPCMRLAAVCVLLLMPAMVCAQDAADQQAADIDVPPLAPPSNVRIEIPPNNDGTQLKVFWNLSPDDRPGEPGHRVKEYRIERADAAIGEFASVGNPQPSTVMEFHDRKLPRGVSYVYRIIAVAEDGARSQPAMSDAAGVRPTIHLFDTRRAWFLPLTLLVCFWIVYFVYLARKGVQLKIRKIAGLEAVDEAVGRATEMGRPILFVPGIQDMNQIQTVAGITILAHIGRTAAEYDAKIEVPTSRSLVMTAARETLESAYLAAGRPDAYHDDMSYYVTDEQFGYVAYLTGYMVRQKPAACFYLGAFFAESLMLAETGNSIGAIQVAGTAEPAQLPFFVAACDYTLIGEEFFAASAYLSGEPEQLGTLKGQDAGKIIGAILLVIGCALATAASVTGSEQLAAATNYLRFNVLGSE
ncbi:MAG TPA: fibronectin type III domain-containing protein [Phycisphaerales bacterium]|nr:fibronectin type III domain-containing protein [Phycisphaerales bacterium]HRQ74907.1 fibronectin type III domain-containing protein [Phycisphaerales bacterium]